MVEGIWRELWPLIVLVHLPEILTLLGAVALLAGLVVGGVWLKKRPWRGANKKRAKP